MNLSRSLSDAALANAPATSLPPHPPTMSLSPESSTQRSSTDSDRHSSSSPTKELNGDTHSSNDEEDLSHLSPVERLQRELERTREEKETLAGQYRNLLSKLTTMRTTLGNKLKQDAVRAAFLIVL
jgi:hypothetical protein